MDATCLRSMRRPVFRRHDLITGFSTERGNLAWDAKENHQVAETTRGNTDAHDRGGVVSSSVEVAVMALERRDHVIRPEFVCQPEVVGGAS